MRQVGLMITFGSVSSQWMTRAIHNPNSIVSSGLFVDAVAMMNRQ